VGHGLGCLGWFQPRLFFLADSRDFVLLIMGDELVFLGEWSPHQKGSQHPNAQIDTSHHPHGEWDVISYLKAEHQSVTHFLHTLVVRVDQHLQEDVE